MGILGRVGTWMVLGLAGLASADTIGPTDFKKYKEAPPARQIAAPDPAEPRLDPNAPPASYPMVDQVLYEKSGRFIDDQWKVLITPDWRMVLCLSMMVFSLRYIRIRREQDAVARPAPVVVMPSTLAGAEREAA